MLGAKFYLFPRFLDCETRPYCSFCGNICLFDTDKAGLDSTLQGTCQDLYDQIPSLANSTDVCPDRTMLNLGESILGSLGPREFHDYKTFIDEPNADVLFTIDTDSMSSPSAVIMF